MAADTLRFPPDFIAKLRHARSVVVLTGAGFSAESGVPTFRDAQTGLWEMYSPQELATPQAFQRDPRLVWEWYEWRRGLVKGSQPNLGHRALVQMELRVPKFLLVTQNVDGLHQLAGSQRVVELHGNIKRNKCFKEGRIVTDWADNGEIPPRCPYCGSYLRPDVVWFGENLPLGVLNTAWNAARNCEVFFSIGTSAVVQPAASLPLAAAEAGATLVEINPASTPLTPQADYVFQGPSGAILPALVRQVWT